MIGLDEIPAWTESAVCAQVDPDLFFPAKGGTCKEARLVCAGCPVKAECLDYALEHGIFTGIWGGKSERERRAMRRRDTAVAA